jgi:protocatechuate 3,4-dioxygenase beta subunit
MKIFAILLLLLLISTLANAQNCKYDKNGTENPPFVWMQNKLPTQSVRKIQGEVADMTGEPILGATVSVFSNINGKLKFIGSYETDKKGRFCFGGLKKGKYEVRVGQRNFQRYDLELNLEPKSKNALKEMKFLLDIGY